MIRFCFAALALCVLIACAPIEGVGTAEPPKAPGSPNQPHLPPPPDLTPKDASGGAQICGVRGLDPSVCSPTEYCHREIADQCGAADQPGTCRPRPEICTMDYSPVCGCDGQTYSNECIANGAGVSAAYAGECQA